MPLLTESRPHLDPVQAYFLQSIVMHICCFLSKYIFFQNICFFQKYRFMSDAALQLNLYVVEVPSGLLVPWDFAYLFIPSLLCFEQNPKQSRCSINIWWMGENKEMNDEWVLCRGRRTRLKEQRKQNKVQNLGGTRKPPWCTYDKSKVWVQKGGEDKSGQMN